jgi:RHS repeat-associated protein
LGFVVTLLLEPSGVRPRLVSSLTGEHRVRAFERRKKVNPRTTNHTYNTNDQVTQISQAGATTNFSYEAEGRRLTETSGTQITTRHYTDGSDNPTWTTQAATTPGAPITKTEIYTPSLGTGLNVTTTIQNGSATGVMQLHDLRGNTVTTIDLTTNTASGWCSYDEFGNQDSTNPANTNLINYSTYAGAERATNTTGLILMGARVYNPETNQFTSPDPVKGGNENSYTYPNDPINTQDYSGLLSSAIKTLLGTADFLIGIAMFAIGTVACGSAVFACFLITAALGAIGDTISQMARSLILTGNLIPKKGFDFGSIIAATLSAVLTKIVGTGIARYLATKFKHLAERLLEFLTDFVVDTSLSRPAMNTTIKVIDPWKEAENRK